LLGCSETAVPFWESGVPPPRCFSQRVRNNMKTQSLASEQKQKSAKKSGQDAENKRKA
jgi:hypothetical protein